MTDPADAAGSPARAQARLDRLLRQAGAQRLVRTACAGYLALLTALTLWPALSVPGPEGVRSDLIVHFLGFGLLAIALTLSGWFGRPLGSGNLAWSFVAATAYAAIDEAAQGIPAINRSSRLDDFAANLIGIAAASGMLALIANRRPIAGVAGWLVVAALVTAATLHPALAA